MPSYAEVATSASTLDRAREQSIGRPLADISVQTFKGSTGDHQDQGAQH